MLKKIFKKLKSYKNKKYKMEWVLKDSIYKNDQVRIEIITDYSRFKNGQSIKVASALKALTNVRGHKCEKCLNEFWNDAKIPLEIHHKDGNNLNNELDNLQLLCPNCHAQTENWRGKNTQNKIKRIEISDDDFAEALKNNSSIRQALISLGLSPKGGNYTRAYEIAIKYNITKFIK